ncbi:HAD-IIA family hydrolase [Williamsia sp. CHRR-6]|uniref:HAD-IIA family hydrolase n=1 Tax=Williamsia sp. CHRR-6 TaxID=2835871 RepID=UPI001BD969DE|nr:HAD-IIA family hydrolase [Williamsia sp. CHRR-6]MBT0568689.1 HAD-IIA family hydrolase [Williamsia sp. CHRR-6]
MTERDHRGPRASDDRGARRSTGDRNAGRTGRDDRSGRGGTGNRDQRPRDRDRDRDQRRGGSTRAPEPALPDDVVPQDLDPEIRRDLRTLDRQNADAVARHLIMAARLLDEDPPLALEHARAARGRASRVGVVREAVGIAAYNVGDWTEALSELRTARRMSGNITLLPLIADCERGLGRPERAIDIARSEEGRGLTGDEATEMRIVESGARIDMGEFDKAVVTLQGAGLDPALRGTAPARLFYAYGTALHAAGRRDEAVTWFMNAAAADTDDVTDAELKLMELTDPEGFAEAMSDIGEDWSDPEPAPAADAGLDAVDTPAPGVPATDAPPVRDAPLVPDVPVTESAALESPAVESAATESAATEAPQESASPTSPEARASDPVATDPVASDQLASDQLASQYDALLFDLDGTLFAGHRAIDGAVPTLAAVSTESYFVTNNASRRADAVAEHLTDLGFAATARQVVTSAQSAAKLLADHLEPGSRALVVGTDGLAQELREVGIGVTRSADDRPAAVVQGHSPDTGWAQLSEAVLAINAGALWVACNIDPTLPGERGFMIGNGSMVAAVANATGQTPLVAGKPAPPLMRDALERSAATRPLVIGDRLDTDIAGANAIDADSLLVLTGVSTVADAITAPAHQRPTHLSADLAALTAPASWSVIGESTSWTVTVEASQISVASTADGVLSEAARMSLLPAVVHAAWAADIDADITVITPAHDAAAVLRAAGLTVALA